jgi:hypothetical protein
MQTEAPAFGLALEYQVSSATWVAMGRPFFFWSSKYLGRVRGSMGIRRENGCV